MAKYYDWKRTSAPDYQPGDRVYLDASDIQTTQPSKKLSHWRLGPLPVVRKVSNSSYCLRLPPSMSRLHPVFNIVKLTLALEDPVPGQHLCPPPLLEIVNGEEEWIVEAILDSRVINWKLWYLVKWEGFRIEHNSWEPWDGVHAPDLVVDFHQTNPGAVMIFPFLSFLLYFLILFPFRPHSLSIPTSLLHKALLVPLIYDSQALRLTSSSIPALPYTAWHCLMTRTDSLSPWGCASPLFPFCMTSYDCYISFLLSSFYRLSRHSDSAPDVTSFLLIILPHVTLSAFILISGFKCFL